MTSDPDRTSRLTRRRRRRERIAGAALAVLGVAVLVVAVSAIQQQHDRGVAAGTRLPSSSASSSLSPHPTGTSSKPKASRPRSSTSPSPAAAKLPLVVLNNTTIHGLAQAAAQRFEAGGWTVTTYSNYQNDIISTCAYYDPATAQAKDAALALQRQFPTIKRVAPQFSQLSAWHSPIVVILTPDYSP